MSPDNSITTSSRAITDDNLICEIDKFGSVDLALTTKLGRAKGDACCSSCNKETRLWSKKETNYGSRLSRNYCVAKQYFACLGAIVSTQLRAQIGITQSGDKTIVSFTVRLPSKSFHMTIVEQRCLPREVLTSPFKYRRLITAAIYNSRSLWLDQQL